MKFKKKIMTRILSINIGDNPLYNMVTSKNLKTQTQTQTQIEIESFEKEKPIKDISL